MSTAEQIAGEQIQGSIYYHLFSFTILYYDYFLTVGDERRFFWKSHQNWGASLFLLTRYLSLFGNVPVALQNFRIWNEELSVPHSTLAINEFLTTLCINRCNDFQTYHQAFSVVVQSLVAILLTMRVYALHQCSRKVLAGLLFAGAGVIIVGCWSFATKSGTDQKETGIDVSQWIGCNPMITAASGRRFAAAWGSLLAFDTIIFTLTLYKAIVVSRGGEVHLVKLLMRDGTIYFGVLSAANLSNILTFLLADPLLKGVSTSFANVISVTLVARLMINLRKSTYRSEMTSQYWQQKSTALNTRAVVSTWAAASAAVGDVGIDDVDDFDVDTRRDSVLEGGRSA